MAVASSSEIAAVPGPDRRTRKVSSGSSTRSPAIGTITDFSVSPGAKDTLPDLAVKSLAEAVPGFVVQATEEPQLLFPSRCSVNVATAEVPSVSVTVVSSIDT